MFFALTHIAAKQPDSVKICFFVIKFLMIIRREVQDKNV
jgi:hypothetical protein